MRVEIYRVVDISGRSFLHEEVCRNCAKEFRDKGYSIEFDKHLSKYVYENDGVTFYSEELDDGDNEITCSRCDNYLLSDNDSVLENSKL